MSLELENKHLHYTDHLKVRDKEITRMQRLLALLHHRLTQIEDRYTVADPSVSYFREECAEILLTFDASVLDESYKKDKPNA